MGSFEASEKENRMESISRAFQKQKRKKTLKNIEFHNSIQD